MLVEGIIVYHMKSLRWLIPLALLGCAVALFAYRPKWFPGGETVVQRVRGRATVADRLAQYGPQARARLTPALTRAGVLYPPRRLVLLGLKQEKRLEVYAADATGVLRFVRAYSILAASGLPGPTLRFGDMQVPEGIYGIESLNPNSAFHLALRVDYPNQFDRRQAAREGRTELGGDIMIHGRNASIGCLAMGDEAIEDLFVLVAEMERRNVKVILSPLDFRVRSLPRTAAQPQWVHKLHRQIKAEMQQLPASGF